MFNKDSIKVDSTKAYKTVSGRVVYGGGGIIPDVFVPIDTTKASKYFIKCNKKAVQMRFASYIFDKYRKELSNIDNYKSLNSFLERLNISVSFPAFALSRDGIRLYPGEWKQTESYLLPQIKALIARYSRLGEDAFYKLYLPVDDVAQTAIKYKTN